MAGPLLRKPKSTFGKVGDVLGGDPATDGMGLVNPMAVAPIITKESAVRLIRKLQEFLPPDVKTKLYGYTSQFGETARGALGDAINLFETKYPGKLSDMRGTLGQIMGKESWPMFRSTDFAPHAGLNRPSSYSFMPRTAAGFGGPDGEIIKRLTSPEDVLLPGVSDEFELILQRLNPTESVDVVRHDWFPTPKLSEGVQKKVLAQQLKYADMAAMGEMPDPEDIAKLEQLIKQWGGQ